MVLLRHVYPELPTCSDDCTNNAIGGAYVARSQHTGGVQVVMADGAVRFVSDNINRDTWRDVGNRADGPVVGEF